MKNLQPLTDKMAISLSLLCAMHCLLVPLLLVLVPSTAALGLENEAFHLWMVFAVIPTSAFALTMGCRKHKKYQLLALGGSGLFLLILSVLLGHDLLGEFGEKALTTVGAGLVALGHYLNFRLCQKEEPCGDEGEACSSGRQSES